MEVTPKKIPIEELYWENVRKNEISIEEVVNNLEKFAKRNYEQMLSDGEGFLITGVDFIQYVPEMSKNYNGNPVQWGATLEYTANHVSGYFLSQNGNSQDYRSNHSIYECRYTNTPEKMHKFEIFGTNGEEMKISFVYGPKSESERKLFYKPPEEWFNKMASYQESNSDEN